jgi:galactose mutarotase-like enzyme
MLSRRGLSLIGVLGFGTSLMAQSDRAEALSNPLDAQPAAIAAGRTDPNFIAFEPMAGITDAMNLAQKGLYQELQYIAPGGVWEASFRVRPSGF